MTANFYPRTRCDDCGDEVYLRSPSPPTCLVAICGEHLVEWRDMPPRPCQRRRYRAAIGRLQQQFAARLVEIFANQEETASNAGARASRERWRQMWADAAARELRP